MTRPSEGDARTRRLIGLAALAAVVAVGLFVHFALPDTDATDIAADALYVAAVYAFLVLLAPRAPSVIIGVVVLVWCVGVELFQLTGLPEAWGAQFAPIMLVLGTVFDARDLLIYAATAVLLTALDLAGRRILAASSASSARSVGR